MNADFISSHLKSSSQPQIVIEWCLRPLLQPFACCFWMQHENLFQILNLAFKAGVCHPQGCGQPCSEVREGEGLYCIPHLSRGSSESASAAMSRPDADLSLYSWKQGRGDLCDQTRGSQCSLQRVALEQQAEPGLCFSYAVCSSALVSSRPLSHSNSKWT